MKTLYIIIGTLISLLLFYIIRELESNHYNIKKIVYKKTQLIKFIQKEKGE